MSFKYVPSKTVPGGWDWVPDNSPPAWYYETRNPGYRPSRPVPDDDTSVKVIAAVFVILFLAMVGFIVFAGLKATGVL